jgi:acetyl-CoA carboxylase biotin carboxyl carrier protein
MRPQVCYDMTGFAKSEAMPRSPPVSVIKSEIAGTVWKIEISPGQDVCEGDVLVILESMKMEIPVEAPVAGRVGEIMVVEGAAVVEDQPLLRLDMV